MADYSDIIFLMGDIRNNDIPADNPDSTDLFGIVSEKEVIIDKIAHRHSGNSDLTIQTSIMALDKSFNAEEYESGSGRGDLNHLVGIIQQQRRPMGTFSGGQIRSGFNKNYEYDERLMNMNPPSFTRESFFSVVHWLTYTLPKPSAVKENEMKTTNKVSLHEKSKYTMCSCAAVLFSHRI